MPRRRLGTLIPTFGGNMRTAFAFVLLACGLAACAPTQIELRDPRTGQTAQCQGDARSRWNPEATETCARGYEAAGWERMPQD